MTRIAQSARITLKGFEREGVDHNSPLEDQCALVYKAARHYATVNGFEPWVHTGPHGPVQGVKGPMVMKRLVSDLFSRADEHQLGLMNGYINQVLRKTDAAVCVYQPHGKDERPVWFIADRMPAHLTVVALNQVKKSDVSPAHRDPWRDKVEARLTPEEAGENLEPGEVSVTFKEPQLELPPRAESLREHLEAAASRHSEIIERVFEIVTASAVPMHAREVHTLYGGDDVIELTTIRKALKELEKTGRLFTRLEENSERLVRGGGSFPRGKRVDLFWPASPVPVRDRLPDGIEPYKAAQDWDNERKNARMAAADRVLETMTRIYPAHEKPRTVPRIAEAAGLEVELTRSILNEFIEMGLVYRGERNTSQYYLSDSRRKPDEEPELTAEEETQYLEETPASEGGLAPEPAMKPGEVRAQINTLLDKLTGDVFQVTDLENRIRQLEAENRGLADENRRLRDAVGSLKAAIASLGD